MKKLKHYLAIFFLWLAHKIDNKFFDLIINNHEHIVDDPNLTPEEKEVVRVVKTAKKYDEPSGIVYRPTAAELNKKKEDQATREAKEAIAETIKNTPEPTL